MVRRRLASLLVAVVALAGLGGGAVGPRAEAAACVHRLLILSAYPAEADAVLRLMALDSSPTVVVGGHHLYTGTMGGVPVIVGMTGIGLVNARNTAEAALTGVPCIDATLFSGVAGGAARTRIADVAVPARWTLDDSKTLRPVDPTLLAIAKATPAASLQHVNHAGDPACTCTDPDTIPVVDLARTPAVWVGGDGYSSDSNGDNAMACIAGGGDTFGCEPCLAPDRTVPTSQAVVDSLDYTQVLFSGGSAGTVSDKTYDAVDQETAAVQLVADAHHVPFLGFRGISDGPGDPYDLPGFPFQFFVYKQIAAENAAAAVQAFVVARAKVAAAGGVTVRPDGTVVVPGAAGLRRPVRSDPSVSSPAAGEQTVVVDDPPAPGVAELVGPVVDEAGAPGPVLDEAAAGAALPRAAGRDDGLDLFPWPIVASGLLLANALAAAGEWRRRRAGGLVR